MWKSDDENGIKMNFAKFLVVIVLFSQTLLSEAFFLSLTTIGIASLIGLKLYFGYNYILPILNGQPSPLQFSRHNEPPIHPTGDNHVTRFLDMKRPPLVPSHPLSRRRRASGFQLGNGVLGWLEKVDHKDCIHRYLCELGANPEAFGNIGRMTGMMVMMGGFPENSWAQKMYNAGAMKKKCPKSCNEKELRKTIAYFEKHLFASSQGPVTSQTNNIDDEQTVQENDEDNEIPYSF